MKTKKTSRRSCKRGSSQKKQKKQYRIRNWREYNAALVCRGSLTLWVDEAAVGGWYHQQKSGCRGASWTYTSSAIMCALSLQAIYHLPLRATQGLMSSLFNLMQLDLKTPNYSTLSRRRPGLSLPLSQNQSQNQDQNEGVHLVADSTGFKVYGEGEWKVRQHGWSKRRTWRKLHVGFDEATGEILTALATGPERADKEMLGELLDQVQDDLAQVSGDGGYDAAACYGAIAARGARATIPPQRNARRHDAEKDERWRARNQILERIQELQGRRRKDLEWGRKAWKKESGYHRRSLAETGIMRVKIIFGDRLTPRAPQAQDAELMLRCHLLNKITKLGMPQSYAL